MSAEALILLAFVAILLTVTVLVVASSTTRSRRRALEDSRGIAAAQRDEAEPADRDLRSERDAVLGDEGTRRFERDPHERART